MPVCQLSVKKRGLSYLISRRDPEKEEIFRVLKPPSNHKHFLLRGGDSKIKPIFLHLCCREREKYLWGMKIYECFIYYNITLCLVARCWVVWKAIIDGRRRLFVSEAIISHTSALLHSLHFFISIFLYLHFFPFLYFYISIFAFLSIPLFLYFYICISLLKFLSEMSHCLALWKPYRKRV